MSAISEPAMRDHHGQYGNLFVFVFRVSLNRDFVVCATFAQEKAGARGA